VIKLPAIQSKNGQPSVNLSIDTSGSQKAEKNKGAKENGIKDKKERKQLTIYTYPLII
jgi:hypothetical protein